MNETGRTVGGNRLRKYPWLCPVLSVLIAAIIVLWLGLTVFSVLLILLCLACPIMAIWAFFAGERPLQYPIGPEPVTRGMTLNWIAPWYDNLWAPAFGLGRSFRSRVLELAPIRRGDQVLDVGCGTGWLTRRAAEIVGPDGAAWGIDAAPDMIRIALEKTGRAGIAAQFKLATIEALPFADASFDVVIASLTIHHLPPDLKKVAFNEIYRVLRPRGRLFVVEPDRPTGSFLRLLLSPLSLHPNLKEHIDGRIPDLLRQTGFTTVIPVSRWMRLITFWSTQKP